MKVAEALMNDTKTIAAMRQEKFDLVIRDAGSWPTQLPAKMLNVPGIDFIAIGTLLPFGGPTWSIPNPIAYVPQFSSAMLPSPVSLDHLPDFVWSSMLVHPISY